MASKESFQFRKSWVALSICASLCFALANIIIGALSQFGAAGVYYFSAGAFILTTVYWLQMICSKNKKEKRVLIWNLDTGKLDCVLIGCFIAGAILTAAMYFVVQYTFIYCLKSGLNVGIAQSIWATSPFFSALIDWFVYKIWLKKYHIVGICFMISCVLFISLSEFIKPKPEQGLLMQEEQNVPYYVPIAISSGMPLLVALFCLITRYAQEIRLIDATDFTMGYFFIMKGFFVIVSVPYFLNEGFDFKLYLLGGLGSIVEIAACWCCNAAFETGAPFGPILALQDTQVFLCTFFFCWYTNVMPLWMQWVGLACGISGALTLTMPDEMLWFVTCGRKKKVDQRVQIDEDFQKQDLSSEMIQQIATQQVKDIKNIANTQTDNDFKTQV